MSRIREQFAWDDAAMARLRELWAAGVSAIQIGRALGVTSSSVVGKAHRLRLPSRPSPIHRKGAPRPVRVRAITLDTLFGGTPLDTALASMNEAERLSAAGHDPGQRVIDLSEDEFVKQFGGTPDAVEEPTTRKPSDGVRSSPGPLGSAVPVTTGVAASPLDPASPASAPVDRPLRLHPQSIAPATTVQPPAEPGSKASLPEHPNAHSASRTCQYIHGHPGDKRWRFCDAPAVGCSSWCASHAAIVYVQRSPVAIDANV